MSYCEECENWKDTLDKAEAERDLWKSKAEKLAEALEGIERWCRHTPGKLVPSVFAKGCLTPGGEAVLSSNIKTMAEEALADYEKAV